MADRPWDVPERKPRPSLPSRFLSRRSFQLTLVLVAVFAARLVFGLHLQLDGDEATIAVTGLRLGSGHVPLLESNLHYLGALGSYVVAPFLVLFGDTLLAVRAATASLGVATALSLYYLGHKLFAAHRTALLLAAVGSVFPFFAFTWGEKLREADEMLALSIVAAALAVTIGWIKPATRLITWAVFGLACGLALWSNLLAAVAVVSLLVGLGCRAARIGWGRFLVGMSVALAGLAVGFAPWLIAQATEGFPALQGLPAYSVPVKVAFHGFIHQELPVFLGTWSDCAHRVLPVTLTWVALAALVGATMWIRRRPLGSLMGGVLAVVVYPAFRLSGRRSPSWLRPDLGQLQAVDMVLLTAVTATLAVLVGRFNGIPCEPRYYMPAATAFALAGTLVVIWMAPVRVIAWLIAVGCLTVYGVSASLPTVDSIGSTTTGGLIPIGLAALVPSLEAQDSDGMYADYWLARPLQYYSGTALPVGVYSGPVGFPDLQRRVDSAARPDWLFTANDPMLTTFRDYLTRHNVSFSITDVGGLVLVSHLSIPVRPTDLVSNP